MNPSATSAAPRAAHEALDASPRVPDDLQIPALSSYPLPTYNRSSVVEDDVSNFNINARSDVSRTPSKGATLQLTPGGDPCGALAIRPRPQTQVMRPVHRPHPFRPPRGQVHPSFAPK